MSQSQVHHKGRDIQYDSTLTCGPGRKPFPCDALVRTQFSFPRKDERKTGVPSLRMNQSYVAASRAFQASIWDLALKDSPLGAGQRNACPNAFLPCDHFSHWSRSCLFSSPWNCRRNGGRLGINNELQLR